MAKKKVKKKIFKKPKVVYTKNKQTKVKNYSLQKDKEKKALPPGKRTSAFDNDYYEYRKNRTDKPGSLTGAKEKMLKDLYDDYGNASKQLIFWMNQMPSKNKTHNVRLGKKILKDIKKNIAITKKLK